MNWHEYVNETGRVPEWPYEVNYGKENIIESDVLVIGGGVAGCRTAISARQKGATVVVADRGFSKRSGAGGAGVDHWHGAVMNPCSKITPRMYSEAAMDAADGYTNGHARYIVGKEGWDTLLEAEQLGVQIRDEDDEFKGSIFRDEETKLLFAYDLENKHCLRVYGYNIKPCVDKEMRRLGAQVFDRTCITSLLTEGGKKGARVIGATGLNDRTGEFYIFKAKAVVISTGGGGSRLYGFAPELTVSQAMSDLNQSGMGHTIGWLAGAEFISMEPGGGGGMSGMGYAPYSIANNNNTYQGAPTVDINGKEVYYANAFGELVYDEKDIFMPSEEGSFIIGHGIALNGNKPKYNITQTDPGLWQKVLDGEYQMPFYNDLTLLSETSRRLIFGLMLSNEGKCRVPIYKNLTDWGYDPDKDMLQYSIGDYSSFDIQASWAGVNSTPPNWRGGGSGGYLTDWRFQTTLPGLFAAGNGPLPGAGCHGESHTQGRYAGRQAALFAAEHGLVEPDANQIAREKERVYSPINADGDIGWKELNYAIARVMQDYCGAYKTEYTLDMGIRRMNDLLSTEGERMYAANPHELARAVESLSLCHLGIAYMEAGKARKFSNARIRFKRNDVPEESEDWNAWVAISLSEDGVRSRKVPLDYYLQEPFAADLEENYQRYAVL